MSKSTNSKGNNAKSRKKLQSYTLQRCWCGDVGWHYNDTAVVWQCRVAWEQRRLMCGCNGSSGDGNGGLTPPSPERMVDRCNQANQEGAVAMEIEAKPG
jgi:hypothetical protein